MLLHVESGNENFPDSRSAKVHCFFTPNVRFPGNEIHIGVACKERLHSIRQSGQLEFLPAANQRRDEYGKIVKGNYEVREGMTFKVFAQRKLQWSQMAQSGNVLLLMREDAAFRRIRVALTGADFATHQALNIEGRFDILTLPEAERLGIRVPPQFERFFSEQAVSRVFTITVESPERAPRAVVREAVVQNTSGQEVAVPTAHRKRNLDL